MIASGLGRILRSVRAGERHSVAHHPALQAVPETIALESAWFRSGEPMPLESTCMGLGKNISPPLAWNGVPAETVELAMVMEDLDAPLPWPAVHMIACGIPPQRTALAEGALAAGAAEVRFGRGTLGTQGYIGPGPLPGHGPHRYVFYLLALDRPSQFNAPPRLGKFLEGIAGAIAAYGRLTGAYEQK